MPDPIARRTPRIIPVIDIMNGGVVRAIGGRRSDYRPVVSRLTESTDPVEVARAMIAATGAGHVYVADLDGIVHRRPDPGRIRAIQSSDIPVICDAGYRTREDIAAAAAGGVEFFVVATETAGPSLLDSVPADRTAVSIDLSGGRILGDWREWGGSGPGAVVDVAGVAVGHGLEVLILLDLARVGTGAGAGTEALVAAVKKTHPGVYVMAGGGVRTWADVDRLADAGADEVLVASALHDGTLMVPRPL